VALAQHFGWNASDSLMSHGASAKSLAQKINYQKGIYLGEILIARACYVTGDYARGLTEAKAALQIAREKNNIEWERQTISQIGLLYQQTGNFADALEYFTKMISLVDSATMTAAYATALNNSGNCYHKLKLYDEAIAFRRRAIAIRLALGKPNAIGDSYNDLGETFQELNQYDSALFYLSRALVLERSGGDDEMSAVVCMNLGATYFKLRKNETAKAYFDTAYTLSAQIGANDYRLEILKRLAEIAGQEKQFEVQAELLSHVLELNDTLRTEASQTQINRLQAEFDAENKELQIAALETERKQQDALVAEQKKRSTVILIFSIGGILLLGVFLVIVNNRFQVTKKQKLTIEHQKAIVDQKQKEVMDSINYAKRIQYTLLANDELLQKNLPEHFIFFQPKDIVSGDFYWATKMGSGQFYLAVCDSTGHGVPGAFMSLLNTSFLNEAINEKNILSPEAIFNHVRAQLLDSVSQEGGQDGMDGTLLCIDPSKGRVSYAAAHNSPVIVRNGEVIEPGADKMPVGKADRMESFLLFNPELKNGDMLFLFTDGYHDQFGGPKGKKFMYKRLKALLAEIAPASVAEQKEKLSRAFNEWKGELEQIDDVCVVGIRIKF
jgi:serine phosphatase RsbU (regulator of sigma subunit)